MFSNLQSESIKYSIDLSVEMERDLLAFISLKIYALTGTFFKFSTVSLRLVGKNVHM